MTIETSNHTPVYAPAELRQATPLMQQYHDIKSEHPDTLLLFQVGDFYELFYDDAKKASSFLGIALTSRGKHKDEPIPLCGVPVHARDHYVAKLIKGGFKVALCDQLDKPRPGTVVKRGVTRVLTPATLTDSALLDEKSASYLLSLFPLHDSWGVVFGELLTAQLFATVLPANAERILESELIRFFPDEIVIPHTQQGIVLQSYLKKLGYFTTMLDNAYAAQQAEFTEWMTTQFRPATIEVVHSQQALECALTYFYAYMRRNQVAALTQFRTVHLYKPDDFLSLDSATQRNLELVKNVHDGSSKYTLFSVLDRACTPMGSRMIKKWLLRPLVKQEAIEQRYDAVDFLVKQVAVCQELQEYIKSVGDLERVVGRVALGLAHIHDYLALLRALHLVPSITALIHMYRSILLFEVIAQHIADFSALEQLLSAAINDDSSQEYSIKSGFDARLDGMRVLIDNAHQKMVEMELAQQQVTGISSLKIRYNQVFGYYIEITKANLHLVPDHYVRHQTLAGKERYMTQELQLLQHEIERARTEIEQVEKEVFARVKQEVLAYTNALRKLAHAFAHLDALLGLSVVAYNNGYVRPTLQANSHDIQIIGGRHPVVEAQGENRFIANDTLLTDEQSTWIITGPNMGGKSTYLRQVALISILGQMGSFVPAQQARLALIDRVFTRIGAGDNLAGGKSTFLIEMEETAAICSYATRNSLVILDEVGRGTSTFDGLAIAQAVVEYIHQHIRARCLFATHYHELTQLEQQYPGIVSYFAASKKTADGILFLYSMVRGVADGSFGVQVAALAQLPDRVVSRARELVSQLQAHGPAVVAHGAPSQSMPTGEDTARLHSDIAALQAQLARYQRVAGIVSSLGLDDITPRQAMDFLVRLKEDLAGTAG
jgi:DNA mismatch repair protein MutS